jgi:hypothetical protein
MIYAFIGNDYLKRGNGKTLAMTYYLYQAHKEGIRVITNYQTSFSEMLPIMEITKRIMEDDLRNIAIGITEVQIVLNSLGTKGDIVKFVARMVSQTRKREVDIFYDTQRYMDVHIRLREQTDYVYKPFKAHFTGEVCNIDRCKKPHLIYLMCEQPLILKPVKVLRASAVGKLYDSNEIIME